MRYLYLVLATGFGSGFAPRFPGTAGSAAAAVWAWNYHPGLTEIILFSALGVLICGKAEEILDRHDSPRIVFDEFCGLFIAVWKVDSLPLFLLGFTFFRFFDILKPYPLHKLQDLPGGWGIMADDLAAGALARISVYVAGRCFFL